MKRKDWCEFSPEERRIIYKRDYNRCIICGSRSFLGVAHIFVSRAKGGKGCKENGVLLCSDRCHSALDQGKDAEKRNSIRTKCENYLNNLYDIDKESLIYKKGQC